VSRLVAGVSQMIMTGVRGQDVCETRKQGEENHLPIVQERRSGCRGGGQSPSGSFKQLSLLTSAFLLVVPQAVQSSPLPQLSCHHFLTRYSSSTPSALYFSLTFLILALSCHGSLWAPQACHPLPLSPNTTLSRRPARIAAIVSIKHSTCCPQRHHPSIVPGHCS